MPKDPALVQRRNRVTTRATLAAAPRRRGTPHLPRRAPEREWHALTRAWWRDVWRSPMASEYLDQDVHRLYLLADLIDGYWVAPSIARAAEIRQQGACFGLTPIDRRRLQWEVERVEAARKRPTAPRPSPTTDPRQALRAVS